MAINNIKDRKDLGKAVVELTYLKKQLKECKKYSDVKLKKKLQDLPYDVVIPIDKRLAISIKNLPNHVYDATPGIDSSIDAAIEKIDDKIKIIIRKLEN